MDKEDGTNSRSSARAAPLRRSGGYRGGPPRRRNVDPCSDWWRNTRESLTTLKNSYKRLQVILLVLFVGTLVEAQTTSGLYALQFDHVFYQTLRDERNRPEAAKRFGVGQGTKFRFVAIDKLKYTIRFHEIVPVLKNARVHMDEENTEFLTEDDASQQYVIARSGLSMYEYREIGLRWAFGTLVVPYKYLFIDKVVSGGTVGPYLGGQWSIDQNVSLVFGGSGGLGIITDDGRPHPTFSVAGYAGVIIGRTFQVGIAIGSDYAESYSDSGKLWIAGAIGTEFFR